MRFREGTLRGTQPNCRALPVSPRYETKQADRTRSACFAFPESTRRCGAYDSYMTEMAVSEAREQLAAVIESATRTGEPVYLTRRGRPVAVVVDPAVFERLLDDAEDALDRAELALAREQEDYVPWEQVKAELGLA
jgi:prevent-host-death family protein